VLARLTAGLRDHRRAFLALGVAVALTAGCGGDDDDARPAFKEPCDAPIGEAVAAPELVFLLPGLVPLRVDEPRTDLVTLAGQMDGTVEEQAAVVRDRAEELGLDTVFSEFEGLDAEYTYSDGETLYLVAMRQVCDGRIEVRLNESADPAHP
jgi:hypothetical protein